MKKESVCVEGTALSVPPGAGGYPPDPEATARFPPMLRGIYFTTATSDFAQKRFPTPPVILSGVFGFAKTQSKDV